MRIAFDKLVTFVRNSIGKFRVWKSIGLRGTVLTGAARGGGVGRRNLLVRDTGIEMDLEACESAFGSGTPHPFQRAPPLIFTSIMRGHLQWLILTFWRARWTLLRYTGDQIPSSFDDGDPRVFICDNTSSRPIHF